MRGDTVDLGPVLEFMKALWALEQRLNQRSKAMLRSHGVTGPQRLVLLVVDRMGRVPPGALARILHLHPASVTRLAQGLAARGHLRRLPHPTDRRGLLLELTPSGRRVVRRTGGTVEAAVRRAMAAAPPASLESARQVLQQVAEHLGAE